MNENCGPEVGICLWPPPGKPVGGGRGNGHGTLSFDSFLQILCPQSTYIFHSNTHKMVMNTGPLSPVYVQN
jgi:hypothetical protein